MNSVMNIKRKNSTHIYSKHSPIEKENNQVHQRMIKARQYQIDVLKDWVL